MATSSGIEVIWTRAATKAPITAPRASGPRLHAHEMPEAFLECVNVVVRRIRFPRAREPMHVRYPFVLR